MSILKETTEVLERVEEESGIPVEVTTDPSLPTLASIKIARVPVSHHVLTYNPTKPGVDYHIAYQCGFVLRLFENPPDARYEFGGTESGRQAIAADPTSLTFPGPFRTYAGALAAKSAETSSLGKDPAR